MWRERGVFGIPFPREAQTARPLSSTTEWDAFAPEFCTEKALENQCGVFCAKILQTVRKLAGLGLEVARGATGEGIWAFSASVTI